MLTYKLSEIQFKTIYNSLSGIMFYRKEGEMYKVKVGKNSKFANETLIKIGAEILPEEKS